MKILIVSASFYPENSPRSFRTTELVKEFCRQGHDVSLATTYKPADHDEVAKEFSFKIIDLGKRKWNRFKGKGIFPRIANRIGKLFFEYPDIELFFMVKRLLPKLEGFDLLISIAVPHPIHWGVAAVYNEKIATVWAADCGDPYMFSKLDTFRKMPYFGILERSFCKKANYITVPIPEAREAYYPKYRDRILVVPQGVNFAEMIKGLSEYKLNEPIRFVYAGNFIPGRRDPTEFLRVLESANIDFRFEVYTRTPGLLNPFRKSMGNKLIVRDFIPRKEILNIMSKADFLVNINNGVSEQLPSKLIDYFLSGRPVLSINSEVTNPEKIKSFLRRDYSGAMKFVGMDKYKIETIAEQFVSLCQ